MCNSMSITNNVLGPAGHGVTLGNQERKRDQANVIAGQWVRFILFPPQNQKLTFCTFLG